MAQVRLSVIVTTYNRSGHLARCIASLETQTRLPDEVIIADDGSDKQHVIAIREIISRSPLNIRYVRQEHDGFRLAANRNNGVLSSSGDYLFFTDGDAVLFPDVMERHVAACGKGIWVTGGGIWLTEEESGNLSEEVIRSRSLERFWPCASDKRLQKLMRSHARFNRVAFLTRLFPAEIAFRWQRLVGLQFSLHREDFEKVNGCDQNFVGWGREDDDLALRLQLAGVRGKSVRDVSKALHLHHEPAPHTLLPDGRISSPNHAYFRRWRWGRFWAENGLHPGPPPSK